MEMIKIGKIVNVVGLKGEVKVYSYSDYKERFEEIDYLYLYEDKKNIEKVRYVKNLAILKLENINTREEAENLKDVDVFIDESQLRELPEDIFYIKDLIGLKVQEDDGNEIGTLKDVIQNQAQDIYVIMGKDNKEILLPSVKEFVLDISLKNGIITVKLPNGLLEI